MYEKRGKGDCLLTPIGSSIWNWHEGPEPHTSHSTGIQKKHIESFVDHADIFILSRGVTRSLKINEETESFLLSKGKIVYFLQSDEAVKRYSELANKGLKVVALIHITC